MHHGLLYFRLETRLELLEGVLGLAEALRDITHVTYKPSVQCRKQSELPGWEFSKLLGEKLYLSLPQQDRNRLQCP